MTRTEAIAAINDRLAALDDERLLSVAEIVEEMATHARSMRQLTEHELASIEQSKEDFRLGRTFTETEYQADMTTFMTGLKARHAAKR